MALSRVSKFNWDSILSKVEKPELKRALNALRGKANEITSNSARFVKEPENIDFAGYKNKLKFASAAVDQLKSTFDNTKTPEFSGALPQFEVTRRAAMLDVVKSTVEAAKADLTKLQTKLESFEADRITTETTIEHLKRRFPSVGKEVEQEIKEHNWTASIIQGK